MKTTLMVQVPPADKVLDGAGQVFVWLKFALVVIEVIVRGTFWTFLRVTVLAELLLPKVVLPKGTLEGDRVTG